MKKPERGAKKPSAPGKGRKGAPKAPPAGRPRIRDLGVEIGRFEPGPENAITDVEGVRVGHVTLYSGEGSLRHGVGPVRTGVTAVIPAEGDTFRERVFAGTYVLNGAGEVMGKSQIDEWGICETPILLASTLSVGRVADAMVTWLWRRNPGIGQELDVVIPVVAECDDAFLNDAVGRHVREEHVWAALDGATSGPVAEGCVGAGTGMQTFDFGGGIGTSSRRVEVAGERRTLGALVLSNFGACEQLRVDGAPVGQHLRHRLDGVERRPPAGSVVILLATDVPLSARQLARLARRASLSVGRVGGFAANNSGEFVLAWSTRNRIPRERRARVETVEVVLDGELDPLFEAAVDATEEAILNAICAGAAIHGQNGHAVPALPVDEVRKIVARYRAAMRAAP